MSQKISKIKSPMNDNKIFRIMMTMVFVISGVFLVKNLIGKTWMAAVAIGACIVVFAILASGMKLLKIKKSIQKFVISICMMLLVFVISLFKLVHKHSVNILPNVPKFKQVMCWICFV